MNLEQIAAEKALIARAGALVALLLIAARRDVRRPGGGINADVLAEAQVIGEYVAEELAAIALMGEAKDKPA